MTHARIQPGCRANKLNIGYYSGKEVFPRKIIEKNKALFLNNNQFCLKLKSGVSFDKTVEDIKSKFKIVHTYLSEDNYGGYFEYIYKTKKVEKQLNNFLCIIHRFIMIRVKQPLIL